MARTALLRKANLAPLHSEVRHLQNLVADGEAKLVQLERARAQLDTQAEKLKADLHAWKQILSPMRRLPLELLSEIFFCVLGYHDNDDPAVMRSLFLLCRVCSRWRALAFSTPQLWTNMFFSIPEKGPITDDLFAMIDDCLPRSAPHHFRLQFDTLNYATRPPNNVSALLHTLIPFLDRLRSLRMSLPEEALLAFSDFPDRPDALSALDTFHFFFRANLSEPYRNLNIALSPVLLRAPKLRHVQLFNRYDGMALRAWPVPWSQIVTLDLQHFFTTPESVHEALSRCSSLEQCSIGPIPLRHTASVTSTSLLPVYTLPLLKSMSIEFFYEVNDVSEGAASFFRRLNMPALVELQLLLNNGYDVFEVPLFVMHIFSHSGPSLRTLFFLALNSRMGT